MGHHRKTAAKAALAGGLIFFAASVQAEVTWDIVGTALGEPDLAGTVTTPDLPVNCSFGPPSGCPVSGILTIPAGALGGPGTTIDIGADPANVIISISTSPPAPGDDFFLFSISRDGYDCNGSSSFVFQCDFDGTSASYDLVIAEQVPRVAIGSGNIHITGQYLVNGQSISLPPPTSTYAIGDTGPAGGIVFFVTFDNLHGLEVAPADLLHSGWGCSGTPITGADGLALGTGKRNSVDIIAECATADIAARVANDYELNGFTDWFLPSKDELNELYRNRGVAAGFATGSYWSSSEIDSSSAWAQSFSDGSPIVGNRGVSGGNVRAVRAF